MADAMIVLQCLSARAVVYLVVYLLQAVDDGLVILHRKVQCLMDIVGKERVVFYVPSELRTAQQLGAGIEPPAFRLISGTI